MKQVIIVFNMLFRPILYVIGIFLCILAASMSLPLIADLSVQNTDWKVFFACMIMTGFLGGVLIFANAQNSFSLSIKQTFLLTTLSWVVLGFAASTPFYFSDLNLTFSDAAFEAISGITTTGSTILTNLHQAPPGILLWRAILQWLGGVGIIVMALSVLPFLKVGGMQLFKTESSENEKILPRATQLSTMISLVYLGLTFACMIGYKISGMNGFDALAHAMTTIATGGFSNFDSSFGHYDLPWIEINAMIFMIAGSLPFILYIQALRGNLAGLCDDPQVRTFFTVIITAIAVMVLYLVYMNGAPLAESLRRASFNVISLITGTGYTNGNYGNWGGFAVGTLFFVMLIGGCAGSTTCGIKIFRFQVLFENVKVQINQLLYPNGVFTPHYNHSAIPRGVTSAVTSFFFMYLLSFALLSIALSFVGLDFITAMSGALTAVSNVGPGLGAIIGPAGTFAPLPDAAKWIMCFGMILGRLELFTVLVLFMPQFWSR